MPSDKREEIHAYYQSYYAANREAILAKNAAWRARNPGNWRSNAGYRRMLLAVLLQRDGDRCFVCHQILGEDMTVEHPNPIVAGGDAFDATNMALSHKRCNMRRARGEWRQHGKLD
jgi:5-methylcytosine-specific restriction endonuclease McrA